MFQDMGGPQMGSKRARADSMDPPARAGSRASTRMLAEPITLRPTKPTRSSLTPPDARPGRGPKACPTSQYAPRPYFIVHGYQSNGTGSPGKHSPALQS